MDATGSLLFRCCCCSGVVDDIVDQRARVADREREIINKQKRESARAFFYEAGVDKIQKKIRERAPTLTHLTLRRLAKRGRRFDAIQLRA